MTESNANHFRYRFFAGVFLSVFLGFIITGLVTTLSPLPVLWVVSLPFSVLCLIVLLRRRPDHRREGRGPETVGELSTEELRAARSELRTAK